MIIAATGHRPDKLGGYAPGVANRLVLLAKQQLKDLAPTTVISGMALGWDQAVAVACIELNIEWWAYIPFAGQEQRWPEKSQKLYRELMGEAHHIHVVSPGGYAAWKMQTRNVAMVDHANKMLALWNGTQGGTGNCVQYAESQKKPVVNCWPAWQQMNAHQP